MHIELNEWKKKKRCWMHDHHIILFILNWNRLIRVDLLIIL